MRSDIVNVNEGNIINREEQAGDKDVTEVNLNNEKSTDDNNSENVKIERR
jgi:hypothetical protein